MKVNCHPWLLWKSINAHKRLNQGDEVLVVLDFDWWGDIMHAWQQWHHTSPFTSITLASCNRKVFFRWCCQNHLLHTYIGKSFQMCTCTAYTYIPTNSKNHRTWGVLTALILLWQTTKPNGWNERITLGSNWTSGQNLMFLGIGYSPALTPITKYSILCYMIPLT